MNGSDRRPLHIFWDNSNIFVSAKDAAAGKWPGVRADVRVQFDNLHRLATVGRPVRDARSIGSIPPSQQAVWRAFTRKTGIEPELFERGSYSRSEQAVDQALQVWMLRALADYQDSPGIAVLLTGDGAGFNSGSGFFADLQRMHGSGWGVELIAFEATCHHHMQSWAEEVGVFVRLEDYLPAITFIEGLRTSEALSLKRRRAAPVIDVSKVEGSSR